ncbi:MAG: hypothetical protein ACRCVT_03070 [Leadbetterella sp.]
MKYLTLLFALFVFASCKKNDVVVIPGGGNKPDTLVAEKDKEKACTIMSDGRSEGQSYQYTYNKDKKVIGMKGFVDFDTFEYKGDKISRAYHSKTKDIDILFTWIGDNLSRITFDVTSNGTKKSYSSTMSSNSDGSIDTFTLYWPTFKDYPKVKFIYDGKGNVSEIKLIGDDNKTLLKNTGFGEKKSPYYKNKMIGQVLSYFMVYNILAGGENLTYFINKNNVTQSIIYSGNENINFKYDYKNSFNENGYPGKLSQTRFTNKESKITEQTFVYECAK